MISLVKIFRIFSHDSDKIHHVHVPTWDEAIFPANLNQSYAKQI